MVPNRCARRLWNDSPKLLSLGASSVVLYFLAMDWRRRRSSFPVPHQARSQGCAVSLRRPWSSIGRNLHRWVEEPAPWSVVAFRDRVRRCASSTRRPRPAVFPGRSVRSGWRDPASPLAIGGSRVEERTFREGWRTEVVLSYGRVILASFMTVSCSSPAAEKTSLFCGVEITGLKIWSSQPRPATRPCSPEPALLLRYRQSQRKGSAWSSC